MAELDDFDYEFKEEELVDFEGSDYGFGSDEELDLEEEGNAVLPSIEMRAEVPSLTSIDWKEGSRNERGEAASTPKGKSNDWKEIRNERDEAASVPKGKLTVAPETTAAAEETVAVELERRDGAESGEIEEDREENDGGVAAQSVSSLSSLAYRKGFDIEGKSFGESERRHRKADLEDGELDDAAMPEGSDNEAAGTAEGEDEDENDQRERKRRKDRFAAERHSQNLERKERESIFVVASAASQHRGGGSDRQMDRCGGFSKTLSAGGHGMQVGGFGQGPNMGPGIMGPGGPFVPFDIGAAISLRQVGRGLVGPVGGMPVPGGVSMSPFHGAVAVHEHMMRSHRMMQHIAAAGPGRSVPGPLGAFCRRPIGDLEFGHLPRGMLHLQPRGPGDVAAQVSFVSAMNSQRNPRTSHGSSRGSFGQAAGQIGSSPRSSLGRQGAWSMASMPSADLHAVGRGRDEGRCHTGPPIWVDPQRLAVAQSAATQSGVAQGPGQGGNVGYVIGQRVMGAGTPRMHQSLSGKNGVSSNKKLEPDGTWRINGGRSNVVHGARSGADNQRSSTIASGIKRERGADLGKHLSAHNSHAANPIPVGGGASSATNLIQLGGPVQKSRWLTVGGLPESTSMSVVVEAFEKQGKITDFKKEANSDTFTITFANISEAISAKRHMHRSIIAGRQLSLSPETIIVATHSTRSFVLDTYKCVL